MNEVFRNLPENKSIFLASDFHLGAPDHATSRLRENKLVAWLDSIEVEAAGVILVGDLFDFWFEYKTVIPKGYVRFLGKLAALSDRGIPILIFTGNHDLWMFDYFKTELNAEILRKETVFQIGPHKVLIGHGDGIGKDEKAFRFYKKVFTNQLAQWLFKWMHPDVGIWLANTWSGSSRVKCLETDEPFLGLKEALFQHVSEIEKKEHHDMYVFGHRHLPIELPVNEQSTYFNLGDWFNSSQYLQINSAGAQLKTI